MERYIAVDTGKFATKVAEYDAVQGKIRKFQIRTKISEGDFRDDAIEDQTVIVEIDGNVYKIGNGARGGDAALDTNKMSETHKLCTLTALATLASAKEKDEINVAIGLPAKEWANVSKREDYKAYMLPTGDITVSIKNNSQAPVIKKTFTIKNRFVYPESIGALFVDETLYSISPTSITGVIDIGNLNLNAVLFQGTEPKDEKSTTAELGGAVLISELSQELSMNITACDEMITANILKSEDKCLPNNGNLTEEQVEASRQIVKKVLREHAEKVKRCCRARNWSLDLTNIVAIGGTSKDIEEELKEAFGNITVLPNSHYCNAFGYLRMMCSNLLDKIIPLCDTEKNVKEIKEEEKSA